MEQQVEYFEFKYAGEDCLAFGKLAGILSTADSESLGLLMDDAYCNRRADGKVVIWAITGIETNDQIDPFSGEVRYVDIGEDDWRDEEEE